jgi:hypothetical protein
MGGLWMGRWTTWIKYYHDILFPLYYEMSGSVGLGKMLRYVLVYAIGLAIVCYGFIL